MFSTNTFVNIMDTETIRIVSSDNNEVIIDKSLAVQNECLNGLIRHMKDDKIELSVPVCQVDMNNFFEWMKARNFKIDYKPLYERLNAQIGGVNPSCLRSTMERFSITDEHEDIYHLKYLLLQFIVMRDQWNDLVQQSLDAYKNEQKRTKSKDYVKEREFRRKYSDFINENREKTSKMREILDPIGKEIVTVRNKRWIVRLGEKYTVGIEGLLLAHYLNEVDFYEHVNLNISFRNIDTSHFSRLPEEICSKISKEYVIYCKKASKIPKERFNCFLNTSIFLAQTIWDDGFRNRLSTLHHFGFTVKSNRVLECKLRYVMTYIDSF